MTSARHIRVNLTIDIAVAKQIPLTPTDKHIETSSIYSDVSKTAKTAKIASYNTPNMTPDTTPNTAPYKLSI
jgi:hypothetical protein